MESTESLQGAAIHTVYVLTPRPELKTRIRPAVRCCRAWQEAWQTAV